MSDKNRFTSVAILSIIAGTILVASPAHAHGWGWGHHNHYRYYRNYGHYRHHDNYPSSYGEIVITLPGKYVSFVFGGKRYYQCHGEYYRRNGRYFENVASPYGSTTVYRGKDDHWGDGDDRGDRNDGGGHDDWRDRD